MNDDKGEAFSSLWETGSAIAGCRATASTTYLVEAMYLRMAATAAEVTSVAGKSR